MSRSHEGVFLVAFSIVLISRIEEWLMITFLEGFSSAEEFLGWGEES